MEEIKTTQTDNEILQFINNLKNSKTDDEFCENLKRYTTKLADVGQQLDMQRQENRKLRNNNHLLSIELAKITLDNVSLNKKSEDLQTEVNSLNDEIKRLKNEIEILKTTPEEQGESKNADNKRSDIQTGSSKSEGKK